MNRFYDVYGNRRISSLTEIEENCTIFETSGQIRFYDALVTCANTFDKKLGVCLTNDLSSTSLQTICDKAQVHGPVAQLYNALRMQTATQQNNHNHTNTDESTNTTIIQ